jgi:hypothetical protein
MNANPTQNSSLIDFTATVTEKQGVNKNNLPDDMFIPVVEDESTFKKSENNFLSGNLVQKSSGFSFINKTNNQNQNTLSNPSMQAQNSSNSLGGSLIDLQSYESQKSNQLKQLTESISSIYNNPNQNDNKQNPQARNMNYTQMNQPNINISNTFYNMNYPNNNNMGVNMGQTQGGMYPNQMMNHGMGMNTMNNMSNMSNPYMNPMPQNPTIQPMGMPNNPSFNYDYYNNINGQKANSSMGFNFNMGSGLGNLGNTGNLAGLSDLNSGSSLGGHAYTNKKKEDDPFKKLVHFK